MKLLPRRLPGTVRTALAGQFDAGEHILGWAELSTGGHLVATDRGLWQVNDGSASQRFWDDVDKVVWRDGALLLQRLSGQPAESVEYRLARPGRVPEVVRDRVTASIVVNQWHRLPSGGHVRVLGRRRPGRDGVSWSLVFDRPPDAADPACRAAADELLAAARETVPDR